MIYIVVIYISNTACHARPQCSTVNTVKSRTAAV